MTAKLPVKERKIRLLAWVKPRHKRLVRMWAKTHGTSLSRALCDAIDDYTVLLTKQK